MSAPSTASSSPPSDSSVLSIKDTPKRLDEEVGESSRHQTSPMHISSSPIESEAQENTASLRQSAQHDEMGGSRMRRGGPSGRRESEGYSDEADDMILRAARDLHTSRSSTSQQQISSAHRHRALPTHPARDRKRRLTSTAEQGRLQRTRSGEIERSSTRALPHRSVSLMNPSSKGKAPSNGSGSSWATAIDITSSPPEAGPSGSQAYPRQREQERVVNRPSKVESTGSTGRSQVYADRRLPATGAISSRTGENPLPSLPGEDTTRRRYRGEETSRTASMSWEAAAPTSMPRPVRRNHSNSVRDSTFDHNMLSGRPRVQSDAIRNPRRERLPGGNWELSGTDERTLRAFLSGGSETQTLAEALNSPQESDIDSNLPRWQPDADVTNCPICGTVFSFWYRKHHCRKCGRVVCASCSPHRITIPRQYIVRAPDSSLTNASSPTPSRSVVDLTEDDDPVPLSPSINPALGGGEEVRLCNPCVPDPNPNPLGYSGRSRHRSTHSLPTMGNIESTQQGVFNNERQRQDYNAEYERLLSPEARRRLRRAGPEDIHSLARNPPPEIIPWVPDIETPATSTRSEVPDEEICPICDRQFPGCTQPEAREAHIRECIENSQRGAGGARRPAAPTSLRLLKFIATEKDCTDGAECIICLEGFEVGQLLVRLECLCKFHEHCIRDWFKQTQTSKHRDECPTHLRSS